MGRAGEWADGYTVGEPLLFFLIQTSFVRSEMELPAYHQFFSPLFQSIPQSAIAISSSCSIVRAKSSHFTSSIIPLAY